MDTRYVDVAPAFVSAVIDYAQGEGWHLNSAAAHPGPPLVPEVYHCAFTKGSDAARDLDLAAYAVGDAAADDLKV